MSRITDERYALRIKRVCDYIQSNLEKSLSLEELAERESFSKYHFHRQFQEYTGITLAQFVQLMRLKRASYQLVFYPDLRVLDIALEAGFESPESFARAFKRWFGQTPSDFRLQPRWEPWYEKYQFERREYRRMTELNLAPEELNVEIVEMEPITVAVLEHQGPEETINETVSKFKEWRIASGQSPVKSSRTIGVPYSDPATTKPEEFRFDLCGELREDLRENSHGVVSKEIPGGRWARLRHVGAMEGVGVKTRALYGTWLPKSGEELGDFPCYFQYVTLFPEAKEGEQITDIYLPLKS